MSIERIVISAAVAIGVVSCDKPQEKPSSAVPEAKQGFEAKPFHGEVYRAGDDSKTLTLISRDECEVKQGGKIFLCKYTKQDDALRVVMAVMGTNQVVYYKLVPGGGIKEENGTILFTDSEYKSLKKMQEDAEGDAVRVRYERIVALVTESKQQTEAVFKFPVHADPIRVKSDFLVGPIMGDVLVRKCCVDFDTLSRDGKKHRRTVWYEDMEEGTAGFPRSNGWSIQFSVRGDSNQVILYCGDHSQADQYADRLCATIRDWDRRYSAALKEYARFPPSARR